MILSDLGTLLGDVGVLLTLLGSWVVLSRTQMSQSGSGSSGGDVFDAPEPMNSRKSSKRVGAI